MKTKLTLPYWIIAALALAALPLLLLAQDAPGPESAAASPESSPLPGAVAIVAAVVIIARVIVKLTPTPKDDTWLASVITWLKHIGLHIPALALLLTLTLCGCVLNRPFVHRTLVREFDSTGKIVLRETTDELVKSTTLASGDARQTVGDIGAKTTKTGATAGVKDVTQESTSEWITKLLEGSFALGEKAAKAAATSGAVK